jgi:Lecithin:cholesterol acyltransferase
LLDFIKEIFNRNPRLPEPLEGLLADTIHPVVIVPGFIGCWPPKNSLNSRLDPITHVYDSLWELLCRTGYVPNESLFHFGYDWRRGIEELGLELGRQIKQVTGTKVKSSGKVTVDYSKVNIIAHSFGGLVSRAYVQSDSYANNVSRLFCVASPHYGTTAAYYGLANGDSTKIGIPLNSAKGMLYIARLHDQANIFSWIIGIINLIRKKIEVDLFTEFGTIPAIHDLLPVANSNYLFAEANGQEKIYPFGAEPHYPVNHILEKLNSPEYLDRLDKLEELSFFYAPSHQTQARIQVVENKGEPGWYYGKAVEPQPGKSFAPGDTVVTGEAAHINFLPYKKDGSLWKVLCNEYNMFDVLKKPINHVEIVGDPECARFIVNKLLQSEKITPDLWTAPLLHERKATFSALFF